MYLYLCNLVLSNANLALPTVFISIHSLFELTIHQDLLVCLNNYEDGFHNAY